MHWCDALRAAILIRALTTPLTTEYGRDHFSDNRFEICFNSCLASYPRFKKKQSYKKSRTYRYDLLESKAKLTLIAWLTLDY